MKERKQQKIGWTGGWFGGFVWVLILAIVFLVQGKVMQAIIGLLITAAALAAILYFSPWRHPRVSYRLLMLPIYALFLVSLGWGIWAAGGLQQLGFTSGWSALILLPVLIPLWTVGDRKWDSDAS